MPQPNVCLNMIVKNEAHVIRRCLDSVIRHIQTWVIVDTGSTDGTQQIIRDYFARAGIPGELHKRPWKNFGHNRSEALELARPKAHYTMFIDADEVFELAAGQSLPELVADAYSVLHVNRNTPASFWRIQLVRNALPWRWQGVLHEAVSCDVAHRLTRLLGPVTRGMFDSSRNAQSPEEKYSRDAAILEEALKTEPDNARYIFYLGQSWRDAGQPEKALAVYRRRAAMPGWEEEGWQAHYESAKLLEGLGRHAEAIEMYLGAYQRRPTRAEPLCDLARMHRERKAFQVAYLFASRAVTLTKPDEILFVDDSAYQWRCLDELAIASYWVGKFDESLALSQRLLAEGLFPESERKRIEANLRFAKERLASGASGQGAAPASKELWLERSLWAHQQRRYPEAEAAAREALRLAPDYPEAHNNIAAACLALGRYPEAIAAAETAVRLKPDFTLARNNLEWARQQFQRG